MTDDLPQLVQRLELPWQCMSFDPEGGTECHERHRGDIEAWCSACIVNQLAAALDTLTRALAERTQERDTLLGELRADPEGLPNLLRINREYAERCNQDTNKALAAVREARAETEQLRREVNYQRARAVDAEARLAAESVRATAARAGQP